MPRAKHGKPLYQRGQYRLIERPGRNHEIVWYDPTAKRERSRSAGSRDLRIAKDALDRLYLQRERGQAVCETCGRPWEDNRRFMLVQSMIDYDTARQGRASYDAIHAGLKHVHRYLEATGQTAIACEDIDQDWIEGFEEWAMEVPVAVPTKSGEPQRYRDRAPATVNNSVLFLAAAVNFSHKRRDTLFAAGFKPRQPEEVNRTPTYRVGLDKIAEMFDYALRYPVKRRTLLNFLRLSITLVRPEHALYVDVSPAARMWHPEERTLNLLPFNQKQTRKRRPIVPVARQAVDWLNSESGQLVPVNDISSTWSRLQTALELPGEGQAGPKLLRRSWAKLVRDRLDPRDVPELEMFLGHRGTGSVTDLYAPFDPNYLARARAAIESIVDDIEARVPGAFHRSVTADTAKVISIGSGKTP